MTHWVAELLRDYDPRALLRDDGLRALLRDDGPRALFLVVLEALLGSFMAMGVLRRHAPHRLGSILTVPLFSLVLTAVSWLVFMTALAGTYPKLLQWVVPALALSLLSGTAAGAIHAFGRRSARNILLAGSLLACGFSCMLFIGMAGLVRPFALAYDLVAVPIVMVLGAALCGLALWGLDNPVRRHSWFVGAGLTVMILTFGSLAAVLPFDAAASNPGGPGWSPIAVIIAAEAVGVLVLSLAGSLVDNRVATRDRLEADRFRQLADSTFDSILIHRDGKILDGNGGVAALLGVNLEALRASPLARFVAPGADASVWNPDRRTGPAETEIVAADGNRIPVEALSRAISYGGRPALVTALHDVRERLAAEERIGFLAHHDVLTQLPNRALLNQRLDEALDDAKRRQAPLAVLYLDLDGFKLVNDTLGHSAGDGLLCQVADRLRANLRESDFVARVGGDEFVVLQTASHQPHDAAQLAQRIIACLAPAFRVEAQDVNVGASIGVAFYPEDGETATALLKKADIALYRTKETGRGWFRLFESGMDKDARQRRELEQELRAAFQGDEFVLYFQPLFDRDLELVAFEALVRWMHPTRGLVPPVQFIPLAEACGLIIPLGEWVMRTACNVAMGWNHGYRIAVNLSAAQFLRNDVRAMVATILAETGLPPNRLELEITEGMLIDNTEGAIGTLNELRAMGTRLVLDDFGTGYSSLSYLQRLPFDKLKVDRSFVQRIETDEGSRAIVQAIIAISSSLNLEVTAEGVETIEQFDLLRAQGCHEMQGYLLGRPMPKGDVDLLLRSYDSVLPTDVAVAAACVD
jgi:diguanylate cyclase (GGDEF)-like protein/PAS domain S-box-containing protein